MDCFGIAGEVVDCFFDVVVSSVVDIPVGEAVDIGVVDSCALIALTLARCCTKRIEETGCFAFLSNSSKGEMTSRV